MPEPIPDNAAELLDDTTQIPVTVSEVTAIDDIEDKPLTISFYYYNNKMCEIQNLEKNKGRKALEQLKNIGMNVKTVRDFQRLKIDYYPVGYSHGYMDLWHGKITEEVDMREIKLQGEARIFFFIVEQDKKMNIVAITENHLETKKR